MSLELNRVYKDIFGVEPPPSWNEGSLEERQRAFDKFMADADKAEISDDAFREYFESLRQHRGWPLDRVTKAENEKVNAA